MSKKSHWIYGLLVLVLIFSCNSPRRQKKINDGKLYEKLQANKGYLNADEFQRLQLDFSLTALDKYDLSGFDEEDTIASFVKSGNYLWIASCYLENEAESTYPFFRLKETKEKGFKTITNGTIPSEYGECAYELDKLMVRSGDYIFISQKSNGNAYCDDSPLIFHVNGKEVGKSEDFKIITWGGADEESDPVQRDFRVESKSPQSIIFHIREKVIDTELDEVVKSRNYDLNFEVRNNTIYFRDTVYK